MSDIKEDYDLSGYVPDFSFPVAACKITQCSTFAVVCRLKSRRHVVTSQESELVWPEFPLAKMSFPPNAVPKDESFEVTAKVRHARTVHIFTSSIFSSWNRKAFGTVGCWRQQKQQKHRGLARHFPADSPSFRRRIGHICIACSIKILHLSRLLKTGKPF